jgi:hypothetical protein
MELGAGRRHGLTDANSIVFRLIGTRKFVDRRQNSVVPLSNEFLPEVIENTERLYAAIATISLQRV